MAKNTDVVAITPADSPMTNWVVKRLIERVSGSQTSAETKAALRRDIIGQAELFAGPSPTRIEVVLAETAAIALFALRTFEANFADLQEANSLSITQANYHLRRIEHAQRRLESALRTLATVRRLAVPPIRVTIGKTKGLALDE